MIAKHGCWFGCADAAAVCHELDQAVYVLDKGALGRRDWQQGLRLGPDTLVLPVFFACCDNPYLRLVLG